VISLLFDGFQPKLRKELTMSEQMSEDQFKQLMNRLDHIEGSMVKKSDVFQSVLTVQGFMFAIVVGVVVVLNTLIGFG
jgi:tetrahydromethanopterin S-methyltransferase subunit G